MIRYIPVFFSVIGSLFLSCNPDSGRSNASGNEEEVSRSLPVEGEETIKDPEQDYAYLADARQKNALLIRLNQMAAEKAATLSLRDFARQSVQYHQNLQNETELMAEKYSIPLPPVPENQDQQEIKELTELAEKEGTDFDIAYLQTIEDLEGKMLKAYQEGSESAPDQNLRNMAVKTISNLKAHQLAVKELLEEIKAK